jgi:hypothetical protein
MERTKWTDERIDERMAAIDQRFDRESEAIRDLGREIRDLRDEMRSGFSELRAEIAGCRADLWAFQKQVLPIVAGLAIALIGLLGAFVAAQF